MADTAEIVVNEGVRLTNLAAGWANAAALQSVIMWDLGPEKPRYPERPVTPKGKEGDPAYDLAVVEFREELDQFKAALARYQIEKREFDDWNTRNGGPIEISFWSCDATDALDRDARAVKEGRQSRKRYHISARTRGYSRLPNRGLPEGMRPGHGQSDLERRMREGDADMAAALKADPVFGTQELKQ